MATQPPGKLLVDAGDSAVPTSATTWLDTPLIATVQHTAQTVPRRRAHRNFHAQLDDACQRLLVAIEPDSYIAPHRHFAEGKAETMLCLRGRLGVIFFDEDGAITAARDLRAAGDCVGVHIPAREFHTLIAIDPGSVFFETKAGPYAPITEAERAPWAPREGDAAVADYLRKLRQYFD